MARKIAKIAAGIVVVMLLGLATALAQHKKPKKPPVIQLPPKSCTWMGSGADHFKVVASGKTTKDTDSGTTWKCTNGTWSQVLTKGPKAKT